MTFSEFERVLNHCPHFTNFWLFLRVGEFLLFVLLTSMIVADDQFQSMKAPGNQRLQELTPMRLRFREFQEIPFLGGLLHGYRRIRQAA